MEEGGAWAKLAGAANIEPGTPKAPISIALGDRSVWPLGETRGQRSAADRRRRLSSSSRTGREALAQRWSSPSSVPAGAGLSASSSPASARCSRRARRTTGFIISSRRACRRRSAALRAYQEERARAESLAELDRARDHHRRRRPVAAGRLEPPVERDQVHAEGAARPDPPAARALLRGARRLGRTTAKGIDPSFLPHVFDRFRQADAKISRKTAGLGLGLAIVRSIVELHGGTVTAESDGEGLRRDVHRPAADGAVARGPLGVDRPIPVRPPAPVVRVSARARGTSRSSWSTTSTRRATSSGTWSSSATASSHWPPRARRHWRRSTKATFDLLLSDIGMPEMDGYSLIRKVRERAARGSRRIPAVALTAYARGRGSHRGHARGLRHAPLQTN